MVPLALWCFLLLLLYSSSSCPISSYLQSLSPSLLAWMLVSSTWASRKGLLDAHSKQRPRPTSRSSWCCAQAPKASQLFLHLASWSAILVFLCIPSLVKGSADATRSLTTSQDRGKPVLLSDAEDEVSSIGKRIPCTASAAQAGGFIGFPVSSAETEQEVVSRTWSSSSSSSASDSNVNDAQQKQRQPHPKVGIFPPFLEWGEKPLLSPSPLTITIVNHCNASRLQVFPPFSTNSQFYAAAAFREVSVETGQELVLQIVFLPKLAGLVQAVLLIQTSAGGFVVQVQGTGTPSPYKLLPFQTHLTVTAGQTLTRSVVLYNPYSTPLKLNEVRAWPADSDNRTLILTNPLNDIFGVTKCCSDTVAHSGICGCADFTYESASEGDEEDRNRKNSLLLSIRPAASWEIEPGTSVEVVKVEVRAAWSGFIYMSLSSDAFPGSDQLVLPMNVKVAGEGAGVAAVVPDLHAVPEVVNFGYLSSRRAVSKQAIHLRNSGHEFVQINKITHHSLDSGGDGRRNLVAVRYKKDQVVRPGAQVQVAVAWYRGNQQSLSLDTDGGDLKLVIHTNSSVSRQITVPYHAVVLHGSEECSEEKAAAERVIFPKTGLKVQLSLFEKLEQRLFGRSEIDGGIIPSGQVELTEDEEWKGELVIAQWEQSLFLEEAGGMVLFSNVQIGSSEAVWLNLTNPSDKPVSVKLFVSREAQASNCRCPNRVAECNSEENEAAIFSLQEGGVSEMLVGARQQAALGPLVFSPSKRCTWTGLMAVKNNLTVMEWMPLQGQGSSAELSFLDNDLPVEALKLAGSSLELAASSSSLTSSSSSSSVEEDVLNAAASCKQLMNGSLVAKNTGDIPLKVDSVALMDGGCSSQGFELGSCDGFFLAAGETRELKVSYRPDYLSPQVKHGLQLVTSIGTINVPVMVVLPDHVLRLCANIPVYFKYRKLVFYVGLLGLFCLLLILPAKVGKLKNPECGDGPSIAGSLPFFREEVTTAPPAATGTSTATSTTGFSPQILSEDGSAANLAKIRVRVAQQEEDDKVRVPVQGEDNSNATQETRGSSGSGIFDNSIKHRGGSQSPASSPKKSSSCKAQQLERGGKRKRKKGPVSSLVKQEAIRSGASSPCSSSPASPATTPVSSQRPVSPLFPSCEEPAAAKTSSSASTLSSNMLTRLDVEVGRRISSSTSTTSSSGAGASSSSSSVFNPGSSSVQWVPKDEIDAARKKQLGNSKYVHKDKHSSSSRLGDWVTVARKPVADKSGAATANNSTKFQNKKAGPTLTQSATFPGRSNNSNNNNNIKNTCQPQPQICPSARAPGSKILKNDTASTSHLNASVLKEFQQQQDNMNKGGGDSCSSSSSCNTSNRFSDADVPVEQTASVDLVYDIWGDHFGEISRQSNLGGGHETQSLFSVPAFSVLKQQQEQESEAAAAASCSEFSMFSGNDAAAAFNRVATNTTTNASTSSEQGTPTSYFLLSPFDLSYSKRMHFSQPVASSLNFN